MKFPYEHVAVKRLSYFLPDAANQVKAIGNSNAEKVKIMRQSKYFLNHSPENKEFSECLIDKGEIKFKGRKK